jgi:hypothetical protein
MLRRAVEILEQAEVEEASMKEGPVEALRRCACCTNYSFTNR